MRYSFYWVPKKDIELGHLGADWFSLTGRFKKVIENQFQEFQYIDFTPAVNVPAKYGFHAEIVSPFTLSAGKTEADAFLLLKKLTRLFFQFELKLRMSDKKNVLYLDMKHYNSIFSDMKKEFYNHIGDIADTSFDNSHALQPFEIILAHTHNQMLYTQLHLIAKSYWNDVLNKVIQFDAVSLCCQKSFYDPFKELTRLPLKVVY